MEQTQYPYSKVIEDRVYSSFPLGLDPKYIKALMKPKAGDIDFNGSPPGENPALVTNVNGYYCE